MINNCDFLVKGSVLCGRTPTRRVIIKAPSDMRSQTFFVCEHHYGTINQEWILSEMELAKDDA